MCTEFRPWNLRHIDAVVDNRTRQYDGNILAAMSQHAHLDWFKVIRSTPHTDGVGWSVNAPLTNVKL